MTIDTPTTMEIISEAEAYDGIRAGVARLQDVLKAPSYQATLEGPRSTAQLEDDPVEDWPKEAQTVLILGLHHPEDAPHLDYWERGDTWGNRRLREVSESLKQWLNDTYGLTALPLPYHVEKGGIFLKDSAVLSGIGIIGRSNLLLHPEWGPRIRLRSILLEVEMQPTQPLTDFNPCDSCDTFCQKACPVDAFPEQIYKRPICVQQIDADVENKTPDGERGEDGTRNLVVKFCRACELSCPAGT